MDLLSLLGAQVQRDMELRTGSFHLVYVASTGRIFTAADKLLSGEVLISESNLKARPTKVEVPIQEKWDLHVGDKVKIKSAFNDYESLKTILRQTVGWDKQDADAISRVGIIINILNEYDCHVEVSFPNIYGTFELYAGVLERCEGETLVLPPSRFKSGDKVTITASPGLVVLLQRDYEDLSLDMLNIVGKVMAITSSAIYVVFASTVSVKVNPALLQITEGDIYIPVVPNPRGFTPGTRIRITGNLKSFMNQTIKGTIEWEPWMSKLPGKEVKVLLVKHNGILTVCEDTSPSFDIHTSSVLLNDEVDIDEEDLPFKIDDWVKVKITRHMKKLLTSKSIPISIIEYLEYPALVMNYRSEMQCGISFDSITTITVPVSLLEKASDKEAELSRDILSEAKKLESGDEVYFNLGPPNYVRDTLRRNKAGEIVLRILTTKAKIKGFINQNKVVIECCDGKFRKVNKTMLIKSDKFNSQTKQKTTGNDMMNAKYIIDKIENCLEKLAAEKNNSFISPVIQSVSLHPGKPSTLHIGIISSFFNYGDIMQQLQQDPTLKFTRQHDDEHIIVEEIGSNPVNLIVRFTFESVKATVPPSMFTPTIENNEQATEGGTFRETPTSLPLDATRELQHPGGGLENQLRDLEEYQHMELQIGDRMILIPFREATAATGLQTNTVRGRAGRIGEMSKVSIEGIINNIKIE